MRIVHARASLAVLATALACGDPSNEPTDPGALYLSPTARLARASLALRGVRPSVDELRTVAADPQSLPALVDHYLDSPELGATMRALHNEVLPLRVQNLNYTLPAHAPLGELGYNAVHDSLFDEPLRLIEDVIVHDLPYPQIVTADYTMADPIVAHIFGLPHSGEPRWERVVWEDGRGAAGVLATSALHIRYRSTFYNFHRGRANAISRAFLCHDFLDGEIHLDTRINLADPEVVARALTDNPACVGCHQTLDPLASYFFGFRMGPLGAPMFPFSVYNPEAVELWQQTNHRAPAFFGRQVQGLAGLGQAIADDPRFARCMVRNFASYLTEVPAKDLPESYLAMLHDELLAHGFRAKPLLRAIALSERFALAGHRAPEAAERVVGYQKLRPQQLARMIEDLTGYRWHGDSALPFSGWPRIGQVDFLDDDLEGFRVLVGGIDSFFVTRPVHTMNATAGLVVQRLALDAARAAVERESVAGPRRLFAAGSLTSREEPVVRRQLAHLHARIFSELVAPSDPALDDELAVFYGVLDGGGDELRAWILTVAAMLGDLRAVYY